MTDAIRASYLNPEKEGFMSDSPVILTWNFTNWVTVVLMVTLGMLAIKVIHSGAKKYMDRPARGE
jgi:hypothetical protein